MTIRELAPLRALIRRCGGALRWPLALLLPLALVTPRPADAQGAQVVPAGSLVIAMDNDKQNIGALFNLKAYGLAVRLLREEIPLKWVIAPGKGKDGIDFTATASRVAPTTLGAASLSFRGGPLVIPRAYAARARTIISAFGGSVAVYELTQDATVNVHHELQFKPKPWVNSTNAKLATATLIEAGIDDYLVGDQATISTSSCFTIIIEPHNTNTSAAQAIRNFVTSGGNFYAQCASVVAFETHAAGRYLTTAGMTSNNKSAAQTYLAPADPFSQFVGEINHAPGGSEEDYTLATGSTYRASTIFHAQSNGITPATYSELSGGVGLGVGGRVFYSGGHDHSGTALADINLRRMLLNAVLTPAARPSSCAFTVATPDLAVQKTASGSFQEASNGTYTITAMNLGDAATAEAFTVVDTLPAGLTFVSASGTGWTFTTAGQVVTARFAGTLAANANASFTLTVLFGTAAVGQVTNRVTIAGGGEVNTSNNVGAHVGTVAGRPRLSLLKSADSTSRAPGSLLRYTLSFTNQGTAPAVNVVVVDPLPPELLFAVGSPVSTLPSGVSAQVEYSRDRGATWTYQTVSMGCGAPPGFDACVTHVRWRLLSSLSNTAPNNVGSVVFTTRVK